MSDQRAAVKKIRALYELDLEASEIAFLFLGYSGIILRIPEFAIAFDLGKSLNQEGAQAIPNLGLLFFTHTHWDHFQASNA